MLPTVGHMQTHMHDTEKVIIVVYLHLFILKLDQFYQISKMTSLNKLLKLQAYLKLALFITSI